MSTMKSPSVKHVQIFKTKFEWLSRRLSLAGLMSRRQANEVIERGEVTVNGLQAPYNMEVSSAAEIIWKGIRVPYYDTPLLWGVRKPRKVLCTMDDRSDVVTLKQYIHKLKNKAADLLIPDHCFLIHPLPLNAEGLVLLCNDGHFASALQKRDSLIETVRVHGRLPADDLRSLRKGVSINGISYGSVKLIEDKQKDLYSLFRKYNLEVLRYHRYAYGPYRVSLIDDGGIIPLGIHKSLRHLIPTTRAKSVLLPAADYFFSRPKLNHEAGIRTEDHEISKYYVLK
ncbi:hypothetical protein IE077_001259 [Cardiosporidium cionae]|uniref:RNA-binding S4 domain-containing protein n=1 Tax=Cardiosporidium cionae TaxID=476202 RepID=A0ABQ7JDC0_9APIC|nr:hypothetical protein IE077_001259 [Cardiosporidium cionae]|eukprot:KAF8821994.1 hypothetical protein IE077_001259 [Cardiosporidium cionae]